jgi:hypothetical protein
VKDPAQCLTGDRSVAEAGIGRARSVALQSSAHPATVRTNLRHTSGDIPVAHPRPRAAPLSLGTDFDLQLRPPPRPHHSFQVPPLAFCHSQAIIKLIMRIPHLLALFATLSTGTLVHAEESKPSTPPQWLLKAEGALTGTWLNTNEATKSIPKVEIFHDGPTLKIRFWGRTAPRDTPFGPPDELLVLSNHSDPANRPPTPSIATAFATHKADFAIRHFTLRLSGDGLRIEGVTLYTDGSKRSNRIVVETYKKQ